MLSPKVERNEIIDMLDTGINPLVVVTETSAGSFVPTLRNWCTEVEAANLTRMIKVLYPIRRTTTPHNIHNTVASRLIDKDSFPFLSHIQILQEPIKLLAIDQYGNPLGYRFQHMAVITFDISRQSVSYPASTLANPKSGEPANEMKAVGEVTTSTLLLLCPRSDSRSAIMARPTVNCVEVNHALSRTMVSVAMTFPDSAGAELFLAKNQKHASPLMAAPALGIYDDPDPGVLSATVPSGTLDVKALILELQLTWLYAVGHTKIRFKSTLAEETLIDKIRGINSWAHFLSVTNDHGKSFNLSTEVEEKQPEAPDRKEVDIPDPNFRLGICVKNISFSTDSKTIQSVLNTVWQQIPEPSLTSDGFDASKATFAVPNAETLHLFLGRTILVDKRLWTFQQCKIAGPGPRRSSGRSTLRADGGSPPC